MHVSVCLCSSTSIFRPLSTNSSSMGASLPATEVFLPCIVLVITDSKFIHDLSLIASLPAEGAANRRGHSEAVFCAGHYQGRVSRSLCCQPAKSEEKGRNSSRLSERITLITIWQLSGYWASFCNKFLFVLWLRFMIIRKNEIEVSKVILVNNLQHFSITVTRADRGP